MLKPRMMRRDVGVGLVLGWGEGGVSIEDVVRVGVILELEARVVWVGVGGGGGVGGGNGVGCGRNFEVGAGAEGWSRKVWLVFEVAWYLQVGLLFKFGWFWSSEGCWR